MTIIEDLTIIANGDFQIEKQNFPGAECSIELCGVFDSATVTPGYLSLDDVPVFVADLDMVEGQNLAPKTAAGRWVTRIPFSGYIALRVAGGGVSTAIKVNVLTHPL